ncbi:MAG TPA: LysR substrate-binding domain-containing protein [Rhizobacter sp.]|jgi:DNA-binding transcriptional LysR family regulator|nr:LysR substrate-binding domain-containing protein [Rhizobacter sp.]
MSLSLAQLRQFVALAEVGSVGGAARSLGVSQPAVTKSLRALEGELGVVLVRRTARGTELTKHGQTFLLRARSACREIERGQAELADAVKQASGPIVLGASPAAAAALLPGPLKHLRRDFPVDVRIVEGMPVATLPRVRDESLDFALGPALRTPLASDLVATPLYPNEMAIVVRHGHPLAATRSLADLMDSEWITAGLGTASLVVDDMFTAAGLPTPRWVIRCESIPGLIAITAQSDLIATVPKSLLALGIADRLLEPIRVREKMASSMMSLFTKRDSPLSAAAGRLVRLIKEEAKRLRATR